MRAVPCEYEVPLERSLYTAHPMIASRTMPNAARRSQAQKCVVAYITMSNTRNDPMSNADVLYRVHSEFMSRPFAIDRFE